MSACCRAIEDHFDVTKVRSQLDELEKNGPAPETRLLVEVVTKQGARGCQVLDIGAGLGVIAEQLLAAGACKATLVELSPAYSDAAQRRMVEKGLADLITVKQGDFLELAPEIDAAEIVTLDKVICCYPNMAQLVDQSARKALRFYAATYPRDHLLVRLMIRFENLSRRLRQNPFRAYVHSVAALERRLRANGFELRTLRKTFMWRIVLFERVSPPR